jgi:hypothetical protein
MGSRRERDILEHAVHTIAEQASKADELVDEAATAAPSATSRLAALRGAGPRYPIAQVIVTVAEPRYSTGASRPVAPGSAPPIELPDPTATPGWGAASIIG